LEKTISRLAKWNEQCFCAAKVFSRPAPGLQVDEGQNCLSNGESIGHAHEASMTIPKANSSHSDYCAIFPLISAVGEFDISGNLPPVT
jgi:hypothetical protein